jgi:hypothetical protein
MLTVRAVMLSSAHALLDDFFANGAFEDAAEWIYPIEDAAEWTVHAIDPCDTYMDEVRAFIDEINSE